MDSRDQADVRVSHKNKIPQSFFELMESHKYILQILLIFQSWIPNLKLEPHLPKKSIFICFNESLLKIMKNTF